MKLAVPAGLKANAETVFLAGVNGALSFSHIHDLALHHGQGGLRAWAYPFAIDAVTVHALRLLLRPELRALVRVLAWVEFVLFTAASLAVNLLDAPSDDVVGMVMALLPGLAFVLVALIMHLLTHQPVEADEQAEEPSDEVEPPARTSKATKSRKRASGPRVATSRAAIARSLAPDFRRDYTGSESERRKAFTEHVNAHLTGRGLKPLDDRACRRALQEA